MDREKDKAGVKTIYDPENLLGENSKIAEKLREFYTSIQEQELPQKFIDLLEKIDQAEAQSKKNTTSLS